MKKKSFGRQMVQFTKSTDQVFIFKCFSLLCQCDLFCLMELCTQNDLSTFCCLFHCTLSQLPFTSLHPLTPLLPCFLLLHCTSIPPLSLSFSPPLSAAFVSDFVLLCVFHTPFPSPSLSVHSHWDKWRWAPLTVLLIKT